MIIESQKLVRDLTIHFGVLSSSCMNEYEYLEKSKKLAEEIKEFDDFELEDLLFGNVPKKSKLKNTLDQIIMNIERVNRIPLQKRNYEF